MVRSPVKDVQLHYHYDIHRISIYLHRLLLVNSERRPSNKFASATLNRRPSKTCMRAAASAMDVRRVPANYRYSSTGCLKNRGKSMEALNSATAPLDVMLLYNLQDELCDLHDRLQASENANSSRVRFRATTTTTATPCRKNVNLILFFVVVARGSHSTHHRVGLRNPSTPKSPRESRPGRR